MQSGVGSLRFREGFSLVPRRIEHHEHLPFEAGEIDHEVDPELALLRRLIAIGAAFVEECREAAAKVDRAYGSRAGIRGCIRRRNR